MTERFTSGIWLITEVTGMAYHQVGRFVIFPVGLKKGESATWAYVEKEKDNTFKLMGKLHTTPEVLQARKFSEDCFEIKLQDRGYRFKRVSNEELSTERLMEKYKQKVV